MSVVEIAEGIKGLRPRGIDGLERGLVCRIAHSFDDAVVEPQRWDELVCRLGGPIEQTFGWCRTWWKHYGAGRELRLFVFEQAGEVVSIVPLCIEQLGGVGLGLKVARIVGSDFTMNLVEPPIVPRAAREVFEQVVHHIIVKEGCDALHIGPVCERWGCLDELRAASTLSRDRLTTIRARCAGFHTVFDISQGFDAFLSKLSRNQRSNYKRNLNKLDGAFEFKVELIDDHGEAERAFDDFIAMHQQQWQSVGKLGHFGDWPGAVDFHRDLVREQARLGRLRLIRLMAGDVVAAYYYCFEFGGAYHWRLPARRVGPQWDQFALGRVGLLKMLEAAAAEGARKVEAGNGWYAYKEQLNAQALPVRSLLITANRRSSRTKARLVLALADLLDKVYYKLWFCRLAPRVPLKRRGLRPLWIRTRF